jgi:hypothetical protein
VARRSPAPKPKRTPEEQAALIQRGEDGDLYAVAELVDEPRTIDAFNNDPGDIAARIEQDLIVLFTSSPDEQAAIIRYMEHLRTDLDGPAPSPIERLLVDDIVTCWVQLTYVRRRWTHALKDGSITTVNAMEHLLNGAERRFLDAQKTLAQLRRLIIPLVQFNLAKQQVNVVVGSGNGQLEP